MESAGRGAGGILGRVQEAQAGGVPQRAWVRRGRRWSGNGVSQAALAGSYLFQQWDEAREERGLERRNAKGMRGLLTCQPEAWSRGSAFCAGKTRPASRGRASRVHRSLFVFCSLLPRVRQPRKRGAGL